LPNGNGRKIAIYVKEHEKMVLVGHGRPAIAVRAAFNFFLNMLYVSKQQSLAIIGDVLFHTDWKKFPYNEVEKYNELRRD